MIRKRSEITAAIVSLIPFLLQTHIFFTGSRSGVLSFKRIFDLETIYLLIPKFFGGYIISDKWSIEDNVTMCVAGILLLCLLVFPAIKFMHSMIISKNLDNGYLAYITLLTWLGGITFITLALVDIRVPRQFGNEARYYFYQFIIVSWLIIWLTERLMQSEKKRIVLPVILYFIAFSFLFDGSLSRMTQDAHTISWRKELSNAIISNGKYVVPIDPNWGLHVTTEQVRKMIEDSLVFNDVDINMENLNR